MPDSKIFKLAPMSRAFATMTYVYYGFTLILVAGAPIGPLSQIIGLALFGVALLVWAWFKPTDMTVDDQGLLIRWRLRKRLILKSDIESIERLNTRDFGWMIRIGAGGLWGAFGMFKTSRNGMINGYFTRTEDLVLLNLKNARPLLLSPEEPGAFVSALGK